MGAGGEGGEAVCVGGNDRVAGGEGERGVGEFVAVLGAEDGVGAGARDGDEAEAGARGGQHLEAGFGRGELVRAFGVEDVDARAEGGEFEGGAGLAGGDEDAGGGGDVAGGGAEGDGEGGGAG